MWVTEKAVQKAKSEWKEAHALMEDLMFKPHLLTFKAWVWAASTVRFFIFFCLVDASSSCTLHVMFYTYFIVMNKSELSLLLYI